MHSRKENGSQESSGAVLTHDELERKIRLIPNYPREGITFRDLGPIYLDQQGFSSLVELLSGSIEQEIGDFDYIAAMEAQGFIIGGALAQRLHKGFLQIRKDGELPGLTRKVSFSMQYANSALEIQTGIIRPNSRVLIYDDAIATGRTALAARELIEGERGIVAGYVFIMELGGFGGRELLASNKVSSLLYIPPDQPLW